MTPITDAVLWVDRPELMLERACGMSVLERQLFLLASAGIGRVWVADERPPTDGGLRLPPGLEVRWVSRDGDHPMECRLPYAAISGGHFIRREALRTILTAPPSEHVAFQDAERRVVVQVVPSRGERVLQVEKRPMPESSCVSAGASAGEWLLEEARKSHDGFMARVFDRHLSLAITRRLLETTVTPNEMTVFSTLVGLIGCILFLGPTPQWDITGAGLVWLHSVLDGCDGELARLKYRQSKLGGVIDFWGDNVVHIALFTCLGLSRYWTHHSPLYLVLALLASAASAGSAWLAFKSSFKPAAEGTGFKGFSGLPTSDATEDALKRVSDTLAQRDFIYLLVLVAVFHRQDLFLWCGAIGAPIFFFILMYLTARPSVPQGALTPSTRGQTS